MTLLTGYIIILVVGWATSMSLCDKAAQQLPANVFSNWMLEKALFTMAHPAGPECYQYTNISKYVLIRSEPRWYHLHNISDISEVRCLLTASLARG